MDSSWSEFQQHLVEIDSRKLVMDWMQQSIYKVPVSVKDLNPKAYIPYFVTFGPYHCNYERVTEMDVHKQRALNHFIKNSEKPFSVYANAMLEIQHELMASYESLDVNLPSSADKFLQHMLLDSCFMLEILRANEAINNPEDIYGEYSATDPIFSYHGKLFVMPYIRTEMLMLENQLPMFLLVKLLMVEAKTKITDIDQIDIANTKDAPIELLRRWRGKIAPIEWLMRWREKITPIERLRRWREKIAPIDRLRRRRPPYDVEAASSRVKDEDEDDDDVASGDQIDIVNRKNDPIERLRRWRQAALVLNAHHRGRYEGDRIKHAKKVICLHLNRMILRFIYPHNKRVLKRPAGDSLHVLDLYRKSLISRDELSKRHKIPNYRYYKSSKTYMTHSVEKLHEYAIEFQRSDSIYLTDISFDQGKLKLPSITVDGNSEIAFLNMIAFERVHVGAGNEVTSYVSFMGTIIRSAKDVNLLITSNIMDNALGNEKSVADLFEGILREVTPDPGSIIVKIFEQVHAYSKKKWNAWLVNLKDNLVNNYFKNPWTFLTFLAASFVILLAVTQTIYSVLSYYKPEKK